MKLLYIKIIVFLVIWGLDRIVIVLRYLSVSSDNFRFFGFNGCFCIVLAWELLGFNQRFYAHNKADTKIKTFSSSS